MGIFNFFSRKSGIEYFQNGIEALKQDRWDDALSALQKAGDDREGMAQNDKGNLLIALSIVNAAAGYTDRATVGLQYCKSLVASGSTIANFIDGLVSQVTEEKSELPSPFSVNGRQVPMHLFIAKEILITGIETGQIDTEGMTKRALDRIAHGFLNRPN